MRLYPRLILILTLVSYLLASSGAAAHAFPKDQLGMVTKPAISSVIEAPADESMPNCHQAQKADASSSTACEVFCAALSGLASDEHTIDQTDRVVQSRIGFFPTNDPSGTLKMELQPPR